MELTKNDFYLMAHGSCFLGSGGGGGIISTLKLIEQMPEETTIECVSLQDAVKDKQGITAIVAFMGAPAAFKNPVYPPQDLIAAFDDLDQKAQQKYGKSIRYLMPVEIGAMNLAAAYMVACEKNKNRQAENKIKVVDADGAGRAVPQLTMLTMAANGLSCDPSVLARVLDSSSEDSERGFASHMFSNGGLHPNLSFSSGKTYKVNLEIGDPEQIEIISRSIVSSPLYGQYAGLAIWMMNDSELKQADPVECSMTDSLQLGRLLRQNSDQEQLFSEWNKTLVKLFTGILVDIETTTSGGFDHGVATLQNDKETFCVYIQNENIIGWMKSESSPCVMAPDSICWVAEEFVKPEGCPESIRVFSNDPEDWKNFQNKRVTVWGKPSDPKLKSAAMNQIFSDLRSSFGYPGKYLPIGL